MNPVAALRPSDRRLLIVGAFFALLLGVLVPLVRLLGTIGVFQPYLTILVVSPWLLGILVLAIDRPSPVTYWAAPLLLSLIAPALAVCHDGLIIRTWILSGGLPVAMQTLLLNIALIIPFSVSISQMSPGFCPDCGRRAMVPLLRPRGRSWRSALVRWCGSCGTEYGRIGGGPWKRERRTTRPDADAAVGPEASQPGGPDGRPREGLAPHRAPASGRGGHPERPTPA